MRKLTVFFCLLLPILSKAQNWELFPMNQKSYYSTPNDTGFSVRFFHVDSIKTENSSLNYYFNSKNPLLKDGAREELSSFYRRGFCNGDRPDLIEVSGDSVFIKFSPYDSNLGFDFNRFDSFLFLPQGPVEVKWKLSENSDQVVVCTSATEEMVFGVNDSVKKYRVEAGDGKEREIVLSKHFGLLKFYRFKDLPEGLDEKPMQLFGYEKDSVKAGYRQPLFQDYFHFNPGDILMWRNEYSSYSPPAHAFEYRKDSILEILDTDTDFSFRFERITWSNGIASEPEKLETTYSKREWQSVVGSPTEWISFPDLHEKYSRLFFSGVLNVEVRNDDTITEYSLNYDGIFVNQTDVSLIIFAEESKVITLTTKAGIKSESYNTWDSSIDLTLIGSKINGVSDGNLNFPTTIIDRTVPQLEIYPNPAHGLIHIRSENNFTRYEIFNLIGSIVVAGKMENGIISLHSLPNGFYLLKLIDGHGTIFQKKIILKQPN